MQLALRTAGPAIFFSGLTVMAALLVLSLAEVNSTAGLGPIGAMGIAMAMLFMLTMLPALLVVVRPAARSGRSCPTGRADRSLPHARVVAAHRSSRCSSAASPRRSVRGRRRRRGNRVRRGRAAELLRARAGVPPVRPQGAVSADRAQAGRAAPAHRRDARLLAADRRARRRPPGRVAVVTASAARAVARACCSSTPGSQRQLVPRRGRVRARARPAVAALPGRRQHADHGVIPDRADVEPCAPRCEAIRRWRRSASR